MYSVTRLIRILVAVALINCVGCQEGFSEQDLLRLQALAAGDQVETITGYSTNVIQRDPVRSEHSANPTSAQYHLNDDATEYHRNHGRSERRKVFRIKNPFQRNLETNERHEEETNGSVDSDPGASNQYSSMQYSLPPEDFLQKMRAENPYMQQYSTPNPLLSYTPTPQSQYQYPTNPSSSYDSNSNSQSNQIAQIDNKSQAQPFQSNTNQYQYGGAFPYENNVQSTPSPLSSYLSTPNTQQYVSTPNNPFVSTSNSQYVSSASSQYLATQPSAYVSSSSPVFLSSQPTLQQYVSSPVSVVQTGLPDYSSRVNTAGSSSLNYDPNEQNKRMQIDHYDNSAHGIRYPIQQYSNEYPSSTTATPTSTPYPENTRDSWQNAINAGVNSLSKSLQEYSLSQYQNSPYNGPTPDGRSDSGPQEPSSSDTHRIGNIPAANNLYLDYMQPDYTNYNMRSRTRDLEQEVSQPGGYSNGDFGWKLKDKKALIVNDGYPSGSSQTRYQTYGFHPESTAMSQMNFYLDNSKAQSQNYEQISKSATEHIEAQEFAKAAAKAHENMKQRQQLQKLTEPYYGHNYPSSYSTSNPVANIHQPPNVVSTFYGNNDNRPRSQYLADNSNHNPIFYGHQQQSQDLITAPPNYYFSNPKELSSLEGKPKQPFDHAKALKNIVPIDVSNVIGTDGPPKTVTDSNGNRFNIPNVSKEQIELNLKQYYKPLTDSYYKDKNSGYGYNIKAKTEDVTSSDPLKQQEQSIPYYVKQPNQDSPYSQSLNDNKRYGDTSAPQVNYITNNYPNSVQQQINAQASMQRQQNQMQSDINSLLKLNDIPYRLTQGLTSDQLRLHNSNFDQSGIPTPIPSRLNQNVGSHQLDVANSILNKLIQSKQQGLSANRPDVEIPTGGALSTINGFRVANPFNVDLKLVAEMLKGKSASDDSHLLQFREQFIKPSIPHKLDMSSLQQLLLKNDNLNYGSLSSINDGLSAIGSPYMEIYNSGRYPYQGVKYSRSQEEEEPLVPIADASNTHPIGAVIESEETVDAREVSEGTDLGDSDSITNVFEESRPKNAFTRDRKGNERHRHPNSIIPNRSSYSRKYPKSDVAEPYPLLKPPPQRPPRNRSSYNMLEKRGRRRRVSRPKFGRALKTEPLFASESKQMEEATPVPTLFRPPSPESESKSDVEETIST